MQARSSNQLPLTYMHVICSIRLSAELEPVFISSASIYNTVAGCLAGIYNARGLHLLCQLCPSLFISDAAAGPAQEARQKILLRLPS